MKSKLTLTDQDYDLLSMENVRRLEENTEVFCKMPEELKKLAVLVTTSNLLVYGAGDNKPYNLFASATLKEPECIYSWRVYKIKQGFVIPKKEKETFKTYPIELNSKGQYYINYQGKGTFITDPELTTLHNFAGYKYPDGKVCGSLRKYKSNRSQSYYTIGLDSLNATDSKTSVVDPVAMVFRA